MNFFRWIASLILWFANLVAVNVAYANSSTFCGSLFYDLYLPGPVSIGVLYKKNRIQIETPRTRIMMSRDFSRFQNARVSHRYTNEEVGDIGVRWNAPTEMHLPLSTKPDQYGQGYATEFKFAMMKFVFATTQAESIYAMVSPHNLGIMALHKKLGFQIIGNPEANHLEFRLTKQDFLKLDADPSLTAADFVRPRQNFAKQKTLHLPDESYQLAGFARELAIALRIWSQEIASGQESVRSRTHSIVLELKRLIETSDPNLLEQRANEIENAVDRAKPYSNLEWKYDYQIRYSENPAEKSLAKALKQVLISEAVRLGVAVYRENIIPVP